ncbi:MAG: integrase arm-type DNA-binding domain-containing protein [Methyloceanibacter sp.]
MPRRALTAVTVERLKPPAKGQIEHFDKGFPGLALRVSYGGGKSWIFFYRIGGRLRRMTLGTYPALSLAEAREAWRDARQEAQRGRDPAIMARKMERGATDFQNVFEEWMRRDQAEHRTAAEVKRMFERYALPAWGRRAIEGIGRRDVLDVIDAIADKGAVAMARRVQSRLNRLFVWCVGRGILTLNPMQGLPKPHSDIKRDRVLSDDELAAVWRGAEAMGWPYGRAVQLLILTGARREEIGRLRWSEVQGDTIHLEGARTKTGKAHLIPLSTPAMALLEDAPRVAGSDYVFTISGRAPIRGWSWAKIQLDELAPISAWRIHDLRRTVATGMQKLGVVLQVVEAALGHTAGSRGGIVGIYQGHDYANEKRAALEAWGAHVVDLVEDREPGKVVPFGGKR